MKMVCSDSISHFQKNLDAFFFSRKRADRRKTIKRAQSTSQYHQTSSLFAWFDINARLHKFSTPGKGVSSAQLLNSAKILKRTANVKEHRYCAHLSHPGIICVAIKNPANNI
mmetsp:Transcript_31612/g.42135  ORF Transcript_31612/g.42135 Transcript_31612/m.42135 type:complete len:112 (+) Transcript_31612:384-719(+)